jgi:hypothetical protein
MKIKNYINKIVAIAAVVALVSGFQLENTEGVMATFESTIGLEEAYAGPCGAAGCEGKTGYCGKEVTVVKVLDWELKKECHGEDKSNGTLPVGEM